MTGSYRLRYRGYDLQTGEVELWVNWQYVRTLRSTAPKNWSGFRHPDIPAGLLHRDRGNYIQFVRAGPPGSSSSSGRPRPFAGQIGVRWRPSVVAGRALGVLLTAVILAAATAAWAGRRLGLERHDGHHDRAPRPRPAPGGSTGAGTGSAASCAASDILPVLKAKMDGTADKYTIVKVRVTPLSESASRSSLRCRTVQICQEGVANCYDPAQVLMAWDGSRWKILNVGTDIGCTSIPLDDQTLVACKALGYPALTTATFKMPSGNIGCELRGTTLRCDIRSGLKPPPAKSCAGDWGGAVLTSHGEAKPSCASDPIYDDSAPLLDYGSTWAGGGHHVPIRYVGPSDAPASPATACP